MRSITNQYDRLEVNIDRLFETTPETTQVNPSGTVKRLINRYTTAILLKTGLYARLVDAGFIRGWFVDFKKYWEEVLIGRPLYLHDFYFLLGIYRQRFQEVETPTASDEKEFLNSWQNPDTLYMLFGAVRRYSYEPLHCYSFEKWIRNNDSVLEYGCGIAPFSFSLLHYGIRRGIQLTIADIRQVNSHYARWRLPSNVNFIEIQPYKHNLIENSYDVVLMITVLEHLPDPLNTIIDTTKSLKPGGVFIFDYILGDGDGQDTKEAVEQREEVIEFLQERFILLEGVFSIDKSMGRTVCRRK